MAIGKIASRQWEGTGNDRRQSVNIVLLPSFPKDKYLPINPGKVVGAIGDGSTIWAESGQELKVYFGDSYIESSSTSNSEGRTYQTEYPYLKAKSLDDGNVHGKVTNDDKEATTWIKKQAIELLPSRWRQLIPFYGFVAASEDELKWKPLREKLDAADHADKAAKVLREIKGNKELPGLVGEAVDSAKHPVESMKMTAGAGKQALKDAGNQIKDDIKDWWDELGGGWKVGLIGLAGVAVIGTAMAISEKVK